MKFQSMGSAECNTAYFHALWFYELDGLVQERRNSISNALELPLSCTNPSKWKHFLHADFIVSLMVGCSHNLLDKHSSGRWAEIP